MALHSSIPDIFRRQLEIHYRERAGALERSIGEAVSSMNARGVLNSSMTGERIGALYVTEFQQACSDGWTKLHRIAGTAGVVASHDLSASLKDVLRGTVLPYGERLVADLQGSRWVFDERQRAKLLDVLRARQNDAVALAESEVDLFARSLEVAAMANRGDRVVHQTYNAPVGNVQTGDGAVANIQQDNRSFVALADALLRLRSSVATNEAATTLIEVAEEEARRPKPSVGAIGRVLTKVATMVSGVADAAPAYLTVKACANAVGIPLP